MVDQNKPELLESIELFYFAYRAFTSHPDRILGERGLGRVHHRLLYFVGRNPGIAVNALRETLGVSKQAMNTPLRQLVEMRLIESSTAAHDRRVKQLSLSADGAELERQLTETQMKLLAEVFAADGEEAAAGWRAVMRALSTRMQY
ncbi:MarR family winged helix-turn-helix transcriptional regulator [Thauera sp. Sel9]|uniref:MarR family winged helix-turn-helix transcriptional regulator n=1 Tax=Thauera sp. Sel9 TaxID=2974299 RepID=UPI0021E16DF5|nr:MarR family transcriptional regulator [Thauera sp. Sel9]MCV2219680.1 MarR family transcriptional regulator [Thauera sp. Sel9]